MSQKFLNNFSKNSQDFEIIKFPTLHLEAENPFGLVFFKHMTYFISPCNVSSCINFTETGEWRADIIITELRSNSYYVSVIELLLTYLCLVLLQVAKCFVPVQIF